jgi:hypothetical protein
VNDRPDPETAREPEPRSIWKLGAAVVLGAAAALSGFVFGMPGHGEFVPIIWLAGFVALLIAPGWPGFVALIAGATVSAALLDVSDGTFGLVFLVVAIVSALAAHGALSASVLRRLWILGWRRGVRDERVLAGGGAVLGVALLFVWLAGDFARNPP